MTELCVLDHRREPGRGKESLKRSRQRQVSDAENRREVMSCLLLGSYQMPWGDCHKQKGLLVPGFPF